MREKKAAAEPAGDAAAAAAAAAAPVPVASGLASAQAKADAAAGAVVDLPVHQRVGLVWGIFETGKLVDV